ncbi:MAG: regulatory signaling modulator protein AmpE [Pseudomonas sp.]
MNFLVLLLVGLILLWTPWHTGYPRDVLRDWVERLVRVGQGWVTVLAVLALLIPLGIVLAAVQGLAYGMFTLLLHVGLLLCCVGRSDPLRSLTADFVAAWQRDDQAAAALVAEQQLGVVDDEADGLLGQVSGRMAATTLQDYFVPTFWYLLLGPLGAVAYRLLELTRQQWGQSASHPAGALVHALEWIPARLMALSFALIGQFDSTLRTLRSMAVEWELSAGELVARCARAALLPESIEPGIGILQDTRKLLIRAILTWAVIIAFLSLMG